MVTLKITAAVFMTAVIFEAWFPISTGSYLDTPRLHFAGHFRADSNTKNNDRCAFEPDNPPVPQNANWNPFGTSEWSFDATVTGAKLADENYSPSSDNVIGAKIISNDKAPFGKLVDLDVDCQNRSTIYGMKFGISFDNGESGFIGDWTPAVIVQNFWQRLRCYSGQQGSFSVGVLSTTTITGIKWYGLGKSKALKNLNEAANLSTGNLQVSVALYFYTRNREVSRHKNFTLGYVIGSIGVANDGEPLNYGGKRLLVPHDQPEILPEMNLDKNCENNDNLWVFNAPFQVNNQYLSIDMSNSLSLDTHGMLINMGKLWVGIIHESVSSTCIELIGDAIEYLPDEHQHKHHQNGAIVDRKLNSQQMQSVQSMKVAIVQQIQESNKGLLDCGDAALHSTSNSDRYIVVLQEETYFVRPMGYYVNRLEFQKTADVTFLVSELGQKPKYNLEVSLSLLSLNNFPNNAVEVDGNNKNVNAEGKVTFTLTVTKKIPSPRRYSNSLNCSGNLKKEFPIDGQVYFFEYSVHDGSTKHVMDEYIIPVLAFETVHYKEPYTWVKDVGPILSQYHLLHQVMHSILDMSNFTQVTATGNRNMMKYSMSLPEGDANYMPVTRDLSPTKRDMILKWLDNPLYDSSGIIPIEQSDLICQSVADHETTKINQLLNVPRCIKTRLSFKHDPENDDKYFKQIFENRLLNKTILTSLKKVRPLIGTAISASRLERFHIFSSLIPEQKCSIEDLRNQLQTALEVEFFTIPIYITSMYSIADTCNREIYDITRSVIMQEMLHMAQVANILIAVGGEPLIDDVSAAPFYPRKGLPGNLVPNVDMTLEKASKEHYRRVFMAIETPKWMEPNKHDARDEINTIGEFYSEISKCIRHLGNEAFISGSTGSQLTWPWKDSKVGELITVSNTRTACIAIEQIVMQGEGADRLNPVDISTGEFAHFYKFEEIVCGHRLEQVDNDSYAFTGPPIPFQPEGVWPMRDNPNSKSLKPNTNCFTEAKIFHKMYRTMLSKLQESFDTANPDSLLESVALMESIQVHAKKLMQLEYDPYNIKDTSTCGPVWDYTWEGPTDM